jgi:hypothetical protein
MPAYNINVLSIGVPIVVEVIDENDAHIDVTTFTTKELQFRKPASLSIITKTAFVVNEPDSSGVLYKLGYTTVSGFMDPADVGAWKARPHLQDGTRNYFGAWVTFYAE